MVNVNVELPVTVTLTAAWLPTVTVGVLPEFVKLAKPLEVTLTVVPPSTVPDAWLSVMVSTLFA